MKYWQRKAVWYLVWITNYLTLAELHEHSAARIGTSLIFMVLGSYWWHAEFGDAALRETKP